MALARIFEALICTCFYAGICYMLFDGAGKGMPELHNICLQLLGEAPFQAIC